MNDREIEQKRLERESTKLLRGNEIEDTKKRKVRKHKKYGKSASRFVKFWLPIKKAIWLFRGIVDFGKLSIPQTKYLQKQLENELKNHYEGIKNEKTKNN